MTTIVNPFVYSGKHKGDAEKTLLSMLKCIYCDQKNTFIPVHTRDTSTITFGGNGTYNSPLYANAASSFIVSSNGITSASNHIRLGQDFAQPGNPAAYTASREIPAGIYNTYITGAGMTYIGNRSIEGTNANFFATTRLLVFNEFSGAGNQTKVANFGTYQYLFVDHNAVLSAALNTTSSNVFRVRGNLTLSLSSDSITANLFSVLFSRAADYISSPIVALNASPDRSYSAGEFRAGVTNPGPHVVTGWLSALTTKLQLNVTSHSLEHFAHIIAGNHVPITGTVTNYYGLYILPLKYTWNTTVYSIYQAGTEDTNLFNGIMKVPNLLPQTDLLTYLPVVVDSNGVLHKLSAWPAALSGMGGAFLGDSTLY